jgi:hypothetical protein
MEATDILHKWLRKYNRDLGNKMAEVSKLIQLLLDHTEDRIFINLLIKFGWDRKGLCFVNTSPDLNALQQALANKLRCFFTQDSLRSWKDADEESKGETIAAQVITGRSFVPQLLLQHASSSINAACVD